MIRFNLSASNNPLFIGFYRNFYNPKKGSMSDFLSQYSKSKPGNFTVVKTSLVNDESTVKEKYYFYSVIINFYSTQ